MRRARQVTDSRARRFAFAPVLMLTSTVAVLAVSAYFPFAWDPPHTVQNDVTRSTKGYLRFGEGEWNFARSSGSPGWLLAAQTAGRLDIELDARPQFPQHNSPASIMMLARDYWHTAFAIEQDDTNLVLWLKRPGSTDNGDPPFTVADVFRPNHWSKVGVQIAGMRLAVMVDGRVRLNEALPSNPLSSWHNGRIALGNEVDGGRGWRGEIRRAKVTTVGDSVDYVRSQALLVPPSYFYLPDHIAPFLPTTAGEWFILVFHLLSFIVLGFLIMWTHRPAVGVASATLTAFGIAVVLALGKFFFHGRHTSVADLVVQFVGGLIGAMLGQWALREAKQSRPASRNGPDPVTATVT
jgi:VanZ like family